MVKTTNNPGRIVAVQPSVAASGSNDIRDIKQPVEIPSGWGWLGWTLGALALAAALALLWRWWRRKRTLPPAIPVVPPHVRARQRLQEALGLLSDPRGFCIAVSDALRVYLEERFQLRAPERTTEEFLQDLQSAQELDAAQKRSLADFLARCDLVKFARFEPNEAALLELHGCALRLVDETRFEPLSPVAPPLTGGVPSS